MTEQPRDVWGSVVPVDLVGTDDPPSRGRRFSGAAGAMLSGGAVVGVLAVVISVVMAAGIFAAASLSGGGPQPEDVLPGTSFAFAKIDLDPSADQKIAIRELASKFPKAPAKDAGGLRDAVITMMLEDSGTGLSFEADVKPWLGSRAGIAGFRPAGGDATSVVAIQTKDRNKADAAIRKAGDGEEPVAFDFRDGYVILAEDARTLDYALDSIDKGPLSEDPEFTADVDAVGSDQVLLAWVDNPAMAEATDMPDDVEGPDRGRTVIGLHATGDFVELESVTIASGTNLRGGGTGTLTRLPADTAAAAYVHDPAHIEDQIADAFGAAAWTPGAMFLPYYFGSSSEIGMGEGDFEEYEGDFEACVATPTAPGAPPAEPVCEDEDDVTVTCRPAPPGAQPSAPECDREEGDPTPFGGDWTEAGDVFNEDVLPLLKDELTVALAAFPPDEDAEFRAGMVARVNGPGNAIEPFERFLEALGVTDSPVRVDGDLVLTTTESGYTDRLGRDGGLGREELFRHALGDLDGSVVGALYVNLDAAEKAYSGYPEELRPVDALGLSLTTDGDRVTTRLRIVVR